jgi:VanZ family protein
VSEETRPPVTTPRTERSGARHAGRWIAFLVCVVVQTLVLYLPRVPAPSAPHGMDKLVHAAVFAAVAWTGLRAGVPTRPLMLALLANAVVSEVYQSTFLPHRSGDPLDAAADAVGVLAVWLVSRRLRAAPSG